MRGEILKPEEVNQHSLLGICTSRKPAVGRSSQSATRSMLVYCLDAIRPVYPNVALLDLRDLTIPFFDGRLPYEYGDRGVNLMTSCIRRASSLLLSVPAYWSGVSGVFKNMIDVLCGPVYEMQNDINTVFKGKHVGLLIIGADDVSAEVGSVQACQIMQSTGAIIVGKPLIIRDPRSTSQNTKELSSEIVALGGELARRAHLSGRRDTL